MTADALNVRSGPGTTYGVVKTLSQGQQVTGTPDNSGWVKIADNQWVFDDYLQASSTFTPSSPSGNASTPTPSSTTYTVTADALNVRSGPGTTYGILRTVSQGQEVTGTPDNSGWVKIADNEWVAASYLQASAPSTPTPATDESVATNPSVGVDLASLQYGDLVQVTSPRINVRTGPGTDYAVIGIVLQDEVLPVTGISTADGWIQLGWGDWIAAQFVKPL